MELLKKLIFKPKFGQKWPKNMQKLKKKIENRQKFKGNSQNGGKIF